MSWSGRIQIPLSCEFFRKGRAAARVISFRSLCCSRPRLVGYQESGVLRILETEDCGRNREVATNALVLTGLPACRGTGSYSEMGSERFSNPAKSGYNKGTIRSDIRYLGVSKDVRRHRLISISSVTAEVASSSLVVPAILSKALRRISLKTLGCAKRARFAPFLCPF